jgi:predicted DNA-binding transcriptional regulator YafY
MWVLALDLLASRRGIPLKQLADRHGWNLRTVYRDVRALEEAGVPVIHDEQRFRVDPSWSGGLQPGITTEEVAALFVARQLVAPLRRSSIGAGLDRLWSRVTSVRGRAGKLIPDEPVWFRTRAPLSIDYERHRETISILETALGEHRVVRCEYTSGKGESTSRDLEPGELYWEPRVEALYLIAYCRLRLDVRVFAVHRIRSIALSRETFHSRAEVSSRQALHAAFRVWRSDHVVTARVHVRRPQADRLAERSWHSSQRMESVTDGVIFTFKIAGYEEIENWVLGLGSSAHVLAPRELADRVAREHEAALLLAAPRLPARAAARKRSGATNL